jgi:hypothetical protein
MTTESILTENWGEGDEEKAGRICDSPLQERYFVGEDDSIG